MRSIKVYATRISRSVGWSSWSIFTATRTSRSSPPSRRNWRYGDDFEVANRPAAGVITRRPEEPYTTSVRTVLWEPGRVTAPATRESAFPRAARVLSGGPLTVIGSDA